MVQNRVVCGMQIEEARCISVIAGSVFLWSWKQRELLGVLQQRFSENKIYSTPFSVGCVANWGGKFCRPSKLEARRRAHNIIRRVLRRDAGSCVGPAKGFREKLYWGISKHRALALNLIPYKKIHLPPINLFVGWRNNITFFFVENKILVTFKVTVSNSCFRRPGCAQTFVARKLYLLIAIPRKLVQYPPRPFALCTGTFLDLPFRHCWRRESRWCPDPCWAAACRLCTRSPSGAWNPELKLYTWKR